MSKTTKFLETPVLVKGKRNVYLELMKPQDGVNYTSKFPMYIPPSPIKTNFTWGDLYNRINEPNYPVNGQLLELTIDDKKVEIDVNSFMRTFSRFRMEDEFEINEVLVAYGNEDSDIYISHIPFSDMNGIAIIKSGQKQILWYLQTPLLAFNTNALKHILDPFIREKDTDKISIRGLFGIQIRETGPDSWSIFDRMGKTFFRVKKISEKNKRSIYETTAKKTPFGAIYDELNMAELSSLYEETISKDMDKLLHVRSIQYKDNSNIAIRRFKIK